MTTRTILRSSAPSCSCSRPRTGPPARRRPSACSSRRFRGPSRPSVLAEEVIVGELVRASAADLDLGPNQGPRTMAMRVTEVLRGPKAVGDLVDVEYLQPNWPWIKYRGGNGQAVPSCTYLVMEANVGDNIVLALGAVQPRQRLELHGVSWMQPRTTLNAMSKIRSPALLTEIRTIAGLPETDIAPEVVAASAARPDPSWPVAFAVGVVGGALGWWRAGRRERSGTGCRAVWSDQ